MKQKFNYFITELKESAGIFLRMIFGFSVVVVLLFAFLLGVNQVAQEQESKAFITLGVALPEKDTIFRPIITMANNLTSLKGFCRVDECSEEELRENMENGKYNMGIFIPDDFFEKANSMQPAEFTLYAPLDMTLSEKKILSLFESIELVMAVTEGGIVAMYNGMAEYDFPFSIAKMENDVTDIYVSEFMSRDGCFDVKYLSPYGDFSFTEYYVAAMILLGIMLCSMGLVNHYNVERLSFERIFFKKSWERVLCSMMKIVSMGIGFSFLLCLTIFIFDRICEVAGSSLIYARGTTYLVMLLLGVSVSVYYHLLGALLNSEREGKIIIMILVTMIMPLLSGAFIPKAFFPKWLSMISEVMPFSVWHRIMLEGTFGTVSSVSVISIILFDVVMMLVGVIVYNIRIRKNG